MWKQFAISLLFSVLMVCVPAVGVAFLLTPVLPFWPAFGACAVIIFSGTMITKSVLQKKQEVAEAQFYANVDLEDARNTVLITCPCQQHTFPMQVYPNVDNEYVCDVCKNKFSIEVKIEPVLQTDPMNLDNAYKIFEELKKQEAEEGSDVRNPSIISQ